MSSSGIVFVLQFLQLGSHTHAHKLKQWARRGCQPLPSASPTHIAYCIAASLVFCLNCVRVRGNCLICTSPSQRQSIVFHGALLKHHLLQSNGAEGLQQSSVTHCIYHGTCYILKHKNKNICWLISPLIYVSTAAGLQKILHAKAKFWPFFLKWSQRPTCKSCSQNIPVHQSHSQAVSIYALM